MKKDKFFHLLDRLVVPVVIILCGLTLMIRPDAASALVSKVISLGLLLWALTSALIALFGSTDRIKNAFLAVGLFAVSRYLSRDPLALAASTGRILGIMLLVGSVVGALDSNYRASRAYYLATGVLGLVLLILPMTASRVIFIVCGLVIVVVGVVMLLSRIREDRYLDSGDDPNIIDAL